jgi:CelD/BcsL family acetyltransferase involved in cellulose biosynthesis
LRIVLLRKLPEEPNLLRAWNELVQQMERPEVFYTCEWSLAVESAYQSSLKPLVFLGYDKDDLVGVACLSSSLVRDELSFLAGTTADYCEFLSRPQRRAEFVDAVFAELRALSLRSLVFPNLPADSATPSALRTAAKKHGFHLYLRPAYACSQITLGSGNQRQELQNTVMRKRQLRRCIRALEREGPVTVAYLKSWAEIQAALPAFVSAHVARFQAKQGVSFLSSPERQIFMEELARRFSGSGPMTLSILTVASRPVAWSFGFQFHGGWFLYQTTFDIRCEENSPGYCLIARIIIEACEMNTMNRLDLGLGAEAYKEWFANDMRQTLHATCTTSPLRHVGEIARHRIAKEVKRFPKLEAAIRSTRSRFGL